MLAKFLVFPEAPKPLPVEKKGLGPLCRSCSYFCADPAEMNTNQCLGRSEGADGCDLGEYLPELLRENFQQQRLAQG